MTFLGDAALVEGLRARRPEAVAAFHDRFAVSVRRLLRRVLGPDREMADIHHDVFVRALGSIGELRDPAALSAWMTSLTVRTARISIQKRVRRRWLSFLAPEDLPEREAPARSDEVTEALRATYAVLGEMPADERIAFALRFVDGMELTAVAEACGVSLSTIKRRLQRAEAQFVEAARKHPALKPWLEGGTRWGTTSVR
ncbi:RNA polymerase sigma factor RpoE [Minicystis rosea]|nr:RNA polymerase sigma factor RpoE [Minicystis rosea]